MVDPSDSTRNKVNRQTKRLNEDQFVTGVEERGKDLTDIKGVGPETATKLQRSGYNDVKKVARASPNELAAVQGVGEDAAEDLTRAASTASRAEFEELSDINGVGPSLARKLNDAGIRDPYELRGKSQRELAAIDGIGPKRAAKIRADVEFEAPARASTISIPETSGGARIYRKSRDVDVSGANNILKTKEEERPVQPTAGNVFVKGGEKEDAIEDHSERSREARLSDESKNAPIMLDQSQWSRNMGEYDYPGVDTIPRSRELERVREKTAAAMEAGAVGSIEVSSEAAGNWQTAGSYSYGGVEVDTSFRGKESTLAHEVGHGVDDALDRPSGVDARGNEVEGGIFEDEEVLEEARVVSMQRRGREFEEDDEYLNSKNELFADLFAEATINPSSTKKRAPKAFRKLQEETLLETGKF